MSFYKLFGGISGTTDTESSNNGSSSISGVETVERLCDRIQSSSLIEDRREALDSIKSLSKKYKLEVGTHAMPILIDVLDKFRSDSEICCLALDSLYNIMTTDETNEMEQKNLPADITTQFTEMLIKTNSNINLIFDLLDEFEFQTRWSTLKLLNALILNQTQALSDLILEIPRGVSRLMDLLNDSREVIRNDTLLLLNNLTKTNANIQKIIAFESGFDRIMEIIEGEGSIIDGGIIVEDCINLLLNLLQTNCSNQSFFKEANYIKMLCKYLDLSSASGSVALSNGTSSLGVEPELNDTNGSGVWTVQKTTNLSLLLKLIRCLVSPGNQQAIVTDCQKAFSHFGLLHRLCALLMISGVPAELLSEAISTVGEVIRGNSANQTLFSGVQMQSNPPRPIIVILLMSMINEKQPFYLRCSILYCFECFLYKNETAKSNIIETLLPKENGAATPQANQISTGQILCSGLFSQNEIFSNWYCAVAVSHTINDNNELKEQLLRVQLAINTSGAVSLMQQCMNILVEATTAAQNQTTSRYKFPTTVSLLMLISNWLSNCPVSVTFFLNQQQNISYLISQVSSTDTADKARIVQGLTAFLLGLCMLYNTDQVEQYTVEKLRDIIKKRVGIEQFEAKLEFISQHDLYTKTLKNPTFAFNCKETKDLLFDYEFTRLFKSNEILISNVLENKLLPVTSVANNQESLRANLSSHHLAADANGTSYSQEHENIMTQYQTIIRDQDLKIRTLYQENQDLNQTCQQLQANCKNITAILNEKNSHAESLATQSFSSQSKLSSLESKVNFLENKCFEQENELITLKRERGSWNEIVKNSETTTTCDSSASQVTKLQLELKELNQEQENLLTLLQDMELKTKHYKKMLRACGNDQDLSESDGDDEEEEKEAAKLPDIEPLRLNNNFSNNNDDYDNDEYFKHPNYMHEIINQNDYSNNITPNHLKEEEEEEEHNSHSSASSSSSHDNEASRSHAHNDNLPGTYLPPVPINNETAPASNVNPFFAQHPFFKKQLEQNDKAPSNGLQNYFN